MAIDTYTGNRHRRAPLASREQVVDQAMELLDAEGSPGLSMRKLAAALQVSLPTIYAAVTSRNALVQDVLRAALARDVRAVGHRIDDQPGDTPRVLAEMVEATATHPWLHELAQELDTDALLRVAQAVVADTRPSVFDRLAEDVAARGARHPKGAATPAGATERRRTASGAPGGAPPDAAQLLFLVVLLLDDVARLVDAGRCPVGRQGELGQALLSTMLEPLGPEGALAAPSR